MLGPIQTEATSTLCIVGQEDMQMRCGDEYCHASFAYLMSCHFAEEAFAQKELTTLLPLAQRTPLAQETFCRLFWANLCCGAPASASVWLCLSFSPVLGQGLQRLT